MEWVLLKGLKTGLFYGGKALKPETLEELRGRLSEVSETLEKIQLETDGISNRSLELSLVSLYSSIELIHSQVNRCLHVQNTSSDTLFEELPDPMDERSRQMALSELCGRNTSDTAPAFG